MFHNTKEPLHKELAYLKSVFLKKNGYPLLAIKQLMKEIEERQKQKEVTHQYDRAAKSIRAEGSLITITFCGP